MAVCLICAVFMLLIDVVLKNWCWICLLMGVSLNVIIYLMMLGGWYYEYVRGYFVIIVVVGYWFEKILFGEERYVCVGMFG